MGVSFIGNPFEQEEEVVENELEWSEVEDNIQNIFIVRLANEERNEDFDVPPSESSDDSDEPFVPVSDLDDEELEYTSSEEDVSVGTTVSFSDDEEAPESYESNVFDKFDAGNVEEETD